MSSALAVGFLTTGPPGKSGSLFPFLSFSSSAIVPRPRDCVDELISSLGFLLPTPPSFLIPKQNLGPRSQASPPVLLAGGLSLVTWVVP